MNYRELLQKYKAGELPEELPKVQMEVCRKTDKTSILWVLQCQKTDREPMLLEAQCQKADRELMSWRAQCQEADRRQSLLS